MRQLAIREMMHVTDLTSKRGKIDFSSLQMVVSMTRLRPLNS